MDKNDGKIKPGYGIDVNGREYLIPTYHQIWENMETIDINVNREDLHMIIWVFKLIEKQVWKEFAVIKKIMETDTVTDEDRLQLGDELNTKSKEEIIDNLNAWRNYADNYAYYKKHFQKLIDKERESKPKRDGSCPNEFDWTTQPVGVNGICPPEKIAAPRKYPNKEEKK